jgi:type II secretory pathway component PulC
MRAARGVVLLVALVAISVFFAGGVLTAIGPVATPPAPRLDAPGSTAPAPDIPIFTAVELSELTESIARPPFSQSRRPAAAPALPVASPTSLNATLSGVIFSTDDRVAIISSAEDGEPVRLREGDVYLGWTLVEVEVDQVLMERDGRQQRLELDFKAQPAPPQPRERERTRRVREVEPPKE